MEQLLRMVNALTGKFVSFLQIQAENRRAKIIVSWYGSNDYRWNKIKSYGRIIKQFAYKALSLQMLFLRWKALSKLLNRLFMKCKELFQILSDQSFFIYVKTTGMIFCRKTICFSFRRRTVKTDAILADAYFETIKVSHNYTASGHPADILSWYKSVFTGKQFFYLFLFTHHDNLFLIKTYSTEYLNNFMFLAGNNISQMRHGNLW